MGNIVKHQSSSGSTRVKAQTDREGWGAMKQKKRQQQGMQKWNRTSHLMFYGMCIAAPRGTTRVQ